VTADPQALEGTTMATAMGTNLTETTMRYRLQRMVAADQDPKLTDADIDELLRLARRAYVVPADKLIQMPAWQQATLNDQDALWQGAGAFLGTWPWPDRIITLPPDSYPVWQPSTAYALNDVIVPLARNGYLYQLVAPADGGTSGASEPTWPTTGTVTDNGLTWQVYGLSWVPTYDLNAAAAEGWRWKAAAAACRFDFMANRNQFRRSMVHDHCLAMAKAYARKQAYTISILPEHPRSMRSLATTRNLIYGAEQQGIAPSYSDDGGNPDGGGGGYE
jgi:hypothetical protein